jgi:hypothetical protein
VVEKNTSDDLIYNWRNELKGHSSGMKVVANAHAIKLKNQGFNKNEVVELLAAENFDLDLVNKVASVVFNEETNLKTAMEVTVVPTKYSDCAPIIEKTLEKLSAKEFVNKLTQGNHPIVKVDEKAFESWKRLAELAKRNYNARLSLHSELKPWIEEALLNNILVAETSDVQMKTASKNKYVVSMRHGFAEVDLVNGTSTSVKFQEGNYELFGLADEFMVKAADSVSPYERLKRALKD